MYNVSVTIQEESRWEMAFANSICAAHRLFFLVARIRSDIRRLQFGLEADECGIFAAGRIRQIKLPVFNKHHMPGWLSGIASH